ncbi:uncharacterized protein LOC123410205 [Hordeum vulgare subsp. vulgare]|uniref:uncharacterized protein LOC123410205 n=1 Tax=Hordeum vulgare subsp. vulgare TaxID=112509 RepID=UPI001D1A3C59|nr:uncharacterized protein LOC123410205 [Hordeum vulgare subsp. vulgare]
MRRGGGVQAGRGGAGGARAAASCRQETHLVERGGRGEQRMPGRRCRRREVPRHRVVPASRARARRCLLLRPLLTSLLKKQNNMTQMLQHMVIPERPMFYPEYPPQEPEQGVVTLEEDRDPVERVEEALQCLAQDLL